MSLAEEDIKAIKEDIQKGLSSREIISKYHIPIFQYNEIKNSMQSHDYISENRPAIIERHRRKGNVSFLSLIFLILFSITLSYLIYSRMTGPKLGLGVFLLIILFSGLILSFIIES